MIKKIFLIFLFGVTKLIKSNEIIYDPPDEEYISTDTITNYFGDFDIFYPNCYKNDDITTILDIGISVDYGTQLKYNTPELIKYK